MSRVAAHGGAGVTVNAATLAAVMLAREDAEVVAAAWAAERRVVQLPARRLRLRSGAALPARASAHELAAHLDANMATRSRSPE